MTPAAAVCRSKFSEEARFGSNDAVGIFSLVYTDGEDTRAQRRTSRDDIRALVVCRMTNKIIIMLVTAVQYTSRNTAVVLLLCE